MKVWRIAFLRLLEVYGEERATADKVGISDRRVRQLKCADPRFRAQVRVALKRYEQRTTDEQVRAALAS